MGDLIHICYSNEIPFRLISLILLLKWDWIWQSLLGLFVLFFRKYFLQKPQRVQRLLRSTSWRLVYPSRTHVIWLNPCFILSQPWKACFNSHCRWSAYIIYNKGLLLLMVYREISLVYSQPFVLKSFCLWKNLNISASWRGGLKTLQRVFGNTNKFAYKKYFFLLIVFSRAHNRACGERVFKTLRGAQQSVRGETVTVETLWSGVVASLTGVARL